MKEKILIKSVLEGYHFMDKIIKKLDANVLTKGVYSYNTQGYYETMTVAGDILDLTNRKHRLLTIKSLIEDCIKAIPMQSAKLVMLKYVDCFTNASISKMLGFGLKKVSRLIDKAIGDVALFFYANGFNSLNLHNYLKDEDWLVGIYNHHLKYANRFSNKNLSVSYL